MKKIVYIILTILWLFVIFFFSSQNGDVSKNLTIGSIGKVVGDSTQVVDQKEESKEMFIESLIKPVRKSAHAIEYFILGILIFLLLKEFPISLKWLMIGSLIFCVFYACTDEFHQLFIPGRTARLFDIMIDGMGSAAGILLCYVICRKRMKKCH